MKSKVAIVRTAPQTAVADVRRVMRLAGVGEVLDPSATTILKNNLSWHLMYPSANTTPWQLEGTIKALKERGFKIVGEFSCKGYSDWIILKLVGGLNKGRPDKRNLERAAEFAKGLMRF